MNLIATLVAALIPMIVGFVWYNPKVFGNAWMKASGVTEEQMKEGNMAVIFGASLVLSFFLALIMNTITIHQMHIYSLLLEEPGINDPNTELGAWMKGFMEQYKNNFRTFGHGAFHGVIAGMAIALPVLGTNALFERKGFKYIAVNVGYWIVTMALMGGIICAWQ